MRFLKWLFGNPDQVLEQAIEDVVALQKEKELLRKDVAIYEEEAQRMQLRILDQSRNINNLAGQLADQRKTNDWLRECNRRAAEQVTELEARCAELEQIVAKYRSS